MSGRFVIHEHTGAGPVHYDLMLEDGEALAAWRLPAGPLPPAPGVPVPAERIADHRKDYLTYEGPTSNGAGRVRRLDAGPMDVLEKALGLWRVRLRGNLLAGEFELTCVGGRDRWVLQCLAGRS
jgi:hypothetical protein